MYKEFIEKTASVLLLVGVFLLLPNGIPAVEAQVIPSGIPFFGKVEAFVLPTPTCPFAHAKISGSAINPPMGLALVPTSQVFANYRLFTTSATVMGTYLLPPLPCLLPYPVVPISQVGTS